MNLISSSCRRIVVGLGKTGVSCARYLFREGLPFTVVDSRDAPPGLNEFYQQLPDVPIVLGDLDRELLCSADELIVSPGVALAQADIAAAIKCGVNVVGDIELFCRAVTNKPIVAITGSNGKSTVTTLVGDMARQAGVNVAVGGNIGVPALDLLEQDADLYVLELSSFQLETTESLRAAAATVLNVSPDHMDRYLSLADYHAAKQKIYQGCRTAIFNIDDALTAPLLPLTVPSIGFTAGVPDIGQYGLKKIDGSVWLCKGMTKLFSVSSLSIFGVHNHVNVLAALALGEAVGIELEYMTEAISCFPGLPHRCQYVAEIGGVRWFNDSKATNVGASIASIEGLGLAIKGKVVLIAGGDSKSADFTDLRAPMHRYVRQLILIGRDADVLEKQLSGCSVITKVDSLRDAVTVAQELSDSGDVVLLAPACASFDMFKSFEHRGEQFCQLVNELLSESLP